MTFQHGLLAFGALLFAVPLIIHLLNRRKYRKVHWAAMEFLLAAYKRTRRRMRLENLLLLLLRCLLPIALAFAVARPILKNAGILAFEDQPNHHILLLDTSYSMGYQPAGAERPFDLAKHLGLSLLDSIEKRGVQKVTVITTGVQTKTLLLEEIMPSERVRQAWNDIARPSDGARNLVEGLRRAAEIAEKSPDPAKLYVFTDLQTRCFGEEEEKARPGAGQAEPAVAGPVDEKDKKRKDEAKEILQHLKEMETPTLVLDCQPKAPSENVQVLDLALDQRNAIARANLQFTAKIANRSPVRRDIEVAFEVDGQVQRRETAAVDAGAEKSVSFATGFTDEGFHTIACRLPPDGLLPDDERHLVVSVRDRIRVLLVEGSDEKEPQLQETFLIRSLLDPSRGEGDAVLTVFAPTVIDWVQWNREREDLNEWNLVVLCNVDRVTEGTARRLAAFVRGGGSLMVVAGDRIDPESYNLHLLGLDGRGPLPLRLRAPKGFEFGSKEYFTAGIERPDHPIMSDFEEAGPRALFERWPIYRFLATDPARPDESTQVIVKLRDEESSALLAVRTLGLGKSLLFTTTLSQRPDRWNRLDFPWVSLPLLHQAVYWLTVPEKDPYNVSVGQALSAVSREEPRGVSVVLPLSAGGGKRAVAGEPRQAEAGRWHLPAFTETDRAGFYRMEAEVIRAGAEVRAGFLFAANVDPDEGVLSYLTHEQVRARLPVRDVTSELPQEVIRSDEGARSDVGTTLLYLTLAFLLCEGLMAWYVGRRRT